MTYLVECLRCDFSADAGSLREVVDLDREHNAEFGEGHLLRWERREGTP